MQSLGQTVNLVAYGLAMSGNTTILPLYLGTIAGNNGGQVTTSPGIKTSGNSASSIRHMDFNGDGREDIVVTFATYVNFVYTYYIAVLDSTGPASATFASDTGNVTCVASATSGQNAKKFFEEKGLSRAQLDQKVADVYQSLRSIGATHSSFDLAAPWQPFSLDKRTYAFVPYSYKLLARGETTQLQAFFIGVSEDSGSTWKIMDGVSVTPDSIDLIFLGFHGGMLPPKSLTQSSAK